MATPSAIYKDPNSADLYYKQQGQDAFTKIGGPTELQNLAKAGAVEVGGQYQTYTPTAAPTPGPTSTPTPSLEQSPGVFNASSLKSFFDNPTTQYQKQLETLKPQFDQATQNLADINTQLSSVKAPEYSTLYNTEYQSKVAPLDAQAASIKTKVDTIDQSLRTLEDAVRGEIGGQAPEAIIQAEIARRAKPLQLERQGYVDQYETIAGQRDAALQGVTQALSFAGQEYSDQLGLLKERQNIAQSAVDQFNSLIEKGQAASEREVDNFRQSFSLLLQQAPDVLQNLTEEEYGQLQTGFVPMSVMNKISNTIAEQKLNTKEKLDTSVIEVDGRKVLIDNQTGKTIRDLGVVTASEGSLPNSYKEWQLAGQPGSYASWLTQQSGKPPTADQQKAATFAERTQQADQILNQIESQFTGSESLIGGLLPNFAQSSERQQFEQAKRNFINAVLRRESGAAISPSEFDSADKQYFAQPGDSPQVLEQKKQNRQSSINGLINEAAGAYKSDPLDLGFNSPLSMGKKGLDGLKQSIITQESGGKYDAVGLSTPHGNALGKYQIIPKFHFSKIGLRNNAEDQKKFLNSPQLQDKLFGKIIDELSKKYNGDLRKIAAAYYGGGNAAKIVGTKAADKKQTAGGISAPSINEYVNSVLNRIG